MTCNPNEDYSHGDAVQAEEIRAANDPQCIWDAMAGVFADGWEPAHDQMVQAAIAGDDAELGRKFRAIYTKKLLELAEINAGGN